MVLGAILLVIRKQRDAIDENEVFVAGPPITQHPVEQPTPVETAVVAQPDVPETGPPLPEEGLPVGWSMEQWIHYGQQYLDRLGKQP